MMPPNLTAQQIKQLLGDDPDYFNDLSYDDVVLAISNILLIVNRLFPKGIQQKGTQKINGMLRD